MLKIVAIVIIFFACTYMGFYYGERFKNRYSELTDILTSLLLLNNEVIYSNTPVPEALYNVANKSNFPLKTLLSNVSEKLINGESNSVFQAFRGEYEKMKGEFFLIDEDETILSDFTKNLGETGVFGQDKIFNLAIDNIKSNLNKAEAIANKNTKMYRALGICGGAMISIFLM